MNKAHITTIRDASDFEGLLSKHEGPVWVIVGDIRRLKLPEEECSPAEAAAAFAAGYAKFPYHLHFRAFDEHTEYAWYGTSGLKVVVGQGGTLEVDDAPHQHWWTQRQAGSSRSAWKVEVQYLVQDGRPVYERVIRLRRAAKQD